MCLWVAALGFGALIFAWSAWRWWTFRYGTFDLAFYTQALWLALRGEWQVSLLDVPLMGNHAEPIVFLALPAFAICPHPLLLVFAQAVALASMPFTAWRIARRLDAPALPLALATVLLPATGFIGLHEFHPEALAAPLLLLVAEARLAGRIGRFWLWWLLALGTKENIALLLVAWAIVHACVEWRKSAAEQWRWNVLPGLVAAGWLVLYGAWLAPALNGGKVDYAELYSHLGRSGGEIVGTMFTQPARVFSHLLRSLGGGDLLWAMLLPLLALPVLRPRWLLIAAPILLQHLLSWRSSEWTIRFHYAAPLVPLFWLAAAEALPRLRRRAGIAWLMLAACAVAQFWRGPAQELAGEVLQRERHAWERGWKAEMLAQVQADASVTAGHPYLSHLAMRRDLHSLHHVLKGLNTLSRRRFEPPPATDSVLIDYADDSTFSVASGFYHPTMRTVEGDIVPSSEVLLHEFLAGNEWQSRAINSLTVLRRLGTRAPAAADAPGEWTITSAPRVRTSEDGAQLEIETTWTFTVPPKEFRWLKLIASNDRDAFEIVRGLVAPEAGASPATDRWVVRVPPDTEPGDFRLKLFVVDHLAATQGSGAPKSTQIHSLGQARLAPGR
ncbi:MAG: DUF2079 domain-containing protein [Chthoniobacteraceae bacterium]